MPARPRLAAHAASSHVRPTGRTLRVSPAAGPSAGLGRARRPKGKAVARPAARRSRAALGNNAKSTAAAGQDAAPESRRAERYRARAWLSTVRTRSSQRRWKACGKTSVAEGGTVGLKLTGADGGKHAAGFSGLATCGSVWACPVCSAKIARRRTEELEHLLAWNAARGGSVALATFTMRHHTGHKLKALRKALSRAWAHITQSRAWKETRRREGCDGYVRAIECTTGENGWHLHAHVLLLFDGPVTQEFIEEWTDDLYELWAAGLRKSGMEASRRHGVDLRLGTGALDGLGKYLSKLTYEAAGGRFKKGRKGGRTPFELLDDALNTGLADDMDRWFEWENGSKGMQQLVWSDHLKDRSGVKDVKDEEIAESDDLDGGTILVIDPRSWHKVYWEAAELLDTAEQGGCPAAMAWLDSRGYTYETTLRYETLAE